MDQKVANEEERQRRLEQKLIRALGPKAREALDREGVLDIMVNPDGKLWIEEAGKGHLWTGEVIPEAQTRELIYVVASLLGQPISEKRHYIEGVLPFNGSRFTGLVPPLVRAASYSLRKKANTLYTLDDYLKKGTLTPEQIETVRKAIIDSKNILVTGGTGSGKSTFTNALIHELYLLMPGLRIVTLEDTDELMSSNPNTLDLYTTDNDDMRSLLKRTMRVKPDRIIVGEVRDGTALDMLKAWNTGHQGGFCTLHSNSIPESFERIKELVAEATLADLSGTINRAINMIIFLHYDSATNKRSIQIEQFS